MWYVVPNMKSMLNYIPVNFAMDLSTVFVLNIYDFIRSQQSGRPVFISFTFIF